MEYKNLTKKVKIPALGLGTWHMGGDMTADYSQDEKYISAIGYAISKGINHIDTAEIYSAGHAEELVGEAIKKYDRKKLFITTKVWPSHLSHDRLKKACEDSLKRLGTNYIDLYLIHWPNPLANMANAMSALDELKKEGKIKNIGVSNFSISQLQNAQKHTKNKIVCNQVKYNLTDRGPEDGLLEFCQKENIILTAYTPIAKGTLSQSKILETVAKKYHKTPIQVALRYLLEKPNVIAIPKASTKEHIDEIFGALGWKLKKEDQDYLAENF
ncbi:MAG TPA: aldo/keto reductase [Candidatus Saccharimonadales bacterium]|nr:aldo/keto reductase [Candidatus Saccharimonadales bacterium]